jgi:tripartite-type tricarboxylate transporter receptor subunit TctC
MSKNKIVKLTSCIAMLSALFMGTTAQAETEDAASFYKGKNIRWIVPYDPGGGYDEYARLIAPYFSKYTGANVRLDNKPGAGGMRGVNELFASPDDGLTVGIINGSAMVTNQLVGIQGANYKIEEFMFLGRVVADRRVLATSIKNGFGTFENMVNAKDEFKIGATGLGGSTYVDAVVIAEVFKLKQNLIHGFDSSSVIRQSMLRGDIAGMWGSAGSAADSVEDGFNQIILQSGKVRSPDLADVPTVLEVMNKMNSSDQDRELLKAWQGLNDVGRPVAAPPGTPEHKVAFLREAFEKALNDPEFLKVCADSGRAISFATGEEMNTIASDAAVMSDSVREYFVGAIKGEL